ncbi:hypothetical protein DENSPDRAFT_838069 [Dentipellis sp. KUC8613]|nr:hypothetical protein DENSPDRAFT_838069 [Dentipellis sp. KUC8613]
MDSDAVSILSTAPPSYSEIETEPWVPPNHPNELELQPSQAAPTSLEPVAGPSRIGHVEPTPQDRPVTPRPPLPPRRPTQSKEAASSNTQRALPPPPPQEVVLAWSPPPAPAVPQVPSGSATYLFSSASFNTMLLLPSARNDAVDSRPLFHITVNLNCLMPSSYITVIRRGASESGEYVGEFEMGISKDSSTVVLGGHRRLVSLVLTTFYSPLRDQKHLRWKMGETEFMWKIIMKPSYKAIGTLRQTGTERMPEFAHLVPGRLTGPVDNVEDRLTKIRIMPAGRPFVDHIIMSALILERIRLTPSNAETNVLFNYPESFI